MKLDVSSLAHTKWECKYHIVFAPKYRRQIIYGKIKQDIGQMLRKLCEYKGVEIIEAEACKDHIHMLISIPPKYSVAQIMGYLKGKSSLKIYEKYANLKYKYGNRHFWCRGYYVSTVGRNRRAVEQYIRKYLAEHEAELADYRAAKATMGELLGGEKLPKMTELKEKRRQLAAQKKALYTEYRSAQEEMRQAVAVKANIDHLLGVTDGQRKKEQER